MSGRNRLRMLLAVHLVFGLATGRFCFAVGGRLPGISLEFLPLVVEIATVLAQACLLGLWAGFAPGAGWIRLAGLAAGVLILEAGLWVANHGRDNLVFLLTISAAVIAAVSLVLRRRGIELRHLPGVASSPSREGLRFSIRGLMAFTIAVALLLGGARGLRESFGHLGPSLFAIVIWSTSFVILTLAAAWAMLGRSRPLPRAAVVLVVAAALGFLFAYGIGERNAISFVYFMLCSVIQSVLVLGSLLVVRSAGYRLVAREAVPREPALRAVETVNSSEVEKPCGLRE